MAAVYAFILSFVLVPATIYLSRRWDVISRFGAHRTKKEQVPLLGGVAVFVTFLISTYFAAGNIGFQLALASIPIFAMGLMDDFWELSARPKFLLQFLPS